MRAATIVPGRPELAQLAEVPEPVAGAGELLVDGLLVGMCATDVEIAVDGFGSLPPGRDRMVLFHESLGRVRDAPVGSGFATGDLVTGIVRRPDPEPCEACAADAWDFCRNGRYTERGIKELDGYGAQTWTVEPKFAIRLDPALGELGVLTEPASTVAKAWEQAEHVASRTHHTPRTALITGAGPMGLLSALLGVQRGLEVHVLDQVVDGPKPDLVRDLGARYHHALGDVPVRPDVVIECTGSAQLTFEVLRRAARSATTVLIGLSGSDRTLPVRAGAITDKLVLENASVVGCVNGGPHNYRQGVEALAAADQDWLRQLLTRRVPLSQWTEALERHPSDVKVVVDLQT